MASSVADDTAISPNQRLWTPWRMAYVTGTAEPGCVFCNALASNDDVGSLIVHRGVYAFVILNLYPYNTGHLMVVPNAHVRDPAALSSGARAEMAELTASFCTGLRLVMGCDGLNIGMNLGSAAGAGIADHLHQHIVPRWTGDANFMPIVGGTKVLPELLPATYAKIRAEVARQKFAAGSVIVLLMAPDRSGVCLSDEALPRLPVASDTSVWRTVLNAIAPQAAACELLGWGGASSTVSDAAELPALAISFTPSVAATATCRLWSLGEAGSLLPDDDRAVLLNAVSRFA
ncbi:MAG: HIT domain-containing protein [Chloroflexia bacterium]|nr:HIT domain-containing protein [Chloroflexia bacterium]